MRWFDNFIIFFFLGLLLLGNANTGCTHTISTAIFEIKPQANQTVVLWKYQTNLSNPLPQVLLPDGFSQPQTSTSLVDNFNIIQMTFNQPIEEFYHQPISFSNLESSNVNVFIISRDRQGRIYNFLVPASQNTFTLFDQKQIEVSPKAYILLGIRHILEGFDHLLFVLGLMLLIRNIRTLLLTITAFTIAHSITLVLASLEIIILPIAPVEALIALSLIILAIEVVKKGRGDQDLLTQRPWLMAFVFGLLHGFGFASALQDIGFPQQNKPLALFNFNLGVELGQIIFVGLVLLIFWVFHRIKGFDFLVKEKLIPYMIGSLGVFWFLDRMSNIFSL